jgi:HEAT repeat protein
VGLLSKLFGPDVRKLLEEEQYDEINRLVSIDKRIVPKLVSQLASSHLQLRERAAVLLGKMNEPNALPALVGIVRRGIQADRPITNKHSYDVFKYLAVDRYIDTRGYERSIPMVDWVFQDYPGSDKADVVAARKALEKIMSSHDFAPLLSCLVNGNAEVRLKAAEVLMKRSTEIRPPHIENAVRCLIAVSEQDGQPIVRRNARLALRNMGCEAVEPLIEALGDRGGSKRFYMAWTLYWLWKIHADKRAINRIIAALGEEDIAVVAGAYYYFMEKGENSTVPILAKALKEYGELNPQMVKDFLNSGNAELEEAARRWAAAHGFTTAPSDFGTERSWGSRRQQNDKP